jgi:phage/plasmid-associated DNA primase
MMRALRRVLTNKKVTIDEETVAKRIEKYERLVDPVRAFIKEASIEGSDETPLTEADTVTKPALEVAFEHFCKKYKLAPMSPTKFGIVMKQRLGYPDGREATGDRERIWKGIRLNQEYLLVISQGRQTKIG